MSIIVNGKEEQFKEVEKLLKILCPEYQVNKTTGKVELIPSEKPGDSPGCCCITALVESSFTISIFCIDGPYERVPDTMKPISSFGGGATKRLNSTEALLKPPPRAGRSAAALMKNKCKRYYEEGKSEGP